MSVKYLRTAAAALALITVAAIPAQADPWARDTAGGVAPPSAIIALNARSQALNDHYGLGAASPIEVVSQSSGDGFDWGAASLGAGVTLLAAGVVFTVARRRPAVTG